MANNDIDLIKQRLDIVEVVQEYLQLKQSGSNWKGLCPFHHEKSPSFMVSQDKQIFHCFGCAKGGDMFTFVQEMEGIEFAEALRMLAKRAGVELQQRDVESSNAHTKLLDIVDQAQQFYRKQLLEHAEAKICRDYLDERGVTAETQATFGLGYSLDSWDALYNHLTQVGYAADQIHAAGLTIRKDNGSYYDRFRGRLMIPLADSNGQVVGFTARTLKVEDTGGKYINSPQSNVYDKSRIIYGLHLAKTPIKKLGASIVVEGNVDVITAHQAGFPNVVATSGTAFTPDQMRLLKRYSTNVLLAFDMDGAGIQAAQRSIAVALEQGMNVKVITLPKEYKDPDECIKANPAAFRESVREAEGVIDFYFSSITAPLDLTKVEHKKKAVQQLIPVLQMINDSVERVHYVQRLADLVQVPVEVIEQKLAQVQAGTANQRTYPNQNAAKPIADTAAVNPTKPEAPLTRRQRMSDQVIGLLLTMPEQIAYAKNYLDVEYVSEGPTRELYKMLLDYYNSDDQFTVESFQHSLVDQASQAHVDHLQMLVANIFEGADTVTLQQEFISAIRDLHLAYIRHRLQEISYALRSPSVVANASEVDQLAEEAQLLTQQLDELTQE